VAEAIGNRINQCRMSVEPDMARVNLNILGLRRLVLQTALPRKTLSVRLKMEVVGTGGGEANRLLSPDRWRARVRAKRLLRRATGKMAYHVYRIDVTSGANCVS
jgi:hypothetical protein